MITIATLFRTGGVYTAEWVWRLKHGLIRHLPKPLEWELLVLTDVPAGFGPWGVRLQNDLPHWWGKLELFRPGALPVRPTLYLDLDTLVVGDLTAIYSMVRLAAGKPGALCMLQDFYNPKVYESGVMAFHPGGATEAVWEAFIREPLPNMMRWRQDGKFIRENMAGPIVPLQHLVPEQIVSLKVHARAGIPENARLVCAHGRPKFNDAAAGWAHEAWREQWAFPAALC